VCGAGTARHSTAQFVSQFRQTMLDWGRKGISGLGGITLSSGGRRRVYICFQNGKGKMGVLSRWTAEEK
jgi:hypothetical protein